MSEWFKISRKEEFLGLCFSIPLMSGWERWWDGLLIRSFRSYGIILRSRTVVLTKIGEKCCVLPEAYVLR